MTTKIKYKRYTKGYFSEDEKQVIKTTINNIWNCIAYDLLSAGGEDPEKAKCLNSPELAEVCLDADRWRDEYTVHEMEPIMEKLRALGWGSTSWKNAMIDILGKGRIWGY